MPAGLTNEYRLLLVCARKVLSPQQTEEASSAIAAGIDWDLLNRHADQHGLSPLLYSHLQRNLALAVPHQQESQLKFFETNVNNLFLSAALLNILQALEAAGIRALAYKGPALAVSLYGDLNLREMSDLDVLIDRDTFRNARDVLAELGYEPVHKHTRKQEESRLRSDCECEFADRDGKVSVDLHWQITARNLASQFSFEDLWQRRRVLTLGQKPVPILSLEDTVLVLAVHGGKHLWQRLSWLADFAESLHQRPHGHQAEGQNLEDKNPEAQNLESPELDWQALRLRAREAHAERMLLLAMTLVEQVLQVPIPPEFTRAIRDDRALQRLAANIATTLFEERAGAQPDWGRWSTLIQLADSPWDGMRRAARFAICSGPREWEAVRLPDSLFAFYPLVRMAILLRSAPSFFFTDRTTSRD